MQRKPFWAFLVEFFFDWECFYATDNELRFAKSRKKRVPITMKRSAAVLAFSLVALALMIPTGCSAQAPAPTKGFNVNLTATAPAADGDPNAYSYAVYRETIIGTTCDATTSTNWKEITTPTARPTTPAYTDAGAGGTTACYFMVTYQVTSGAGVTPVVSANSGPSNVVSVTVPGVPTAPAVNAPSTSQQSMVQAPEPQNEGGTTVSSVGNLRSFLVRTRR